MSSDVDFLEYSRNVRPQCQLCGHKRSASSELEVSCNMKEISDNEPIPTLVATTDTSLFTRTGIVPTMKNLLFVDITSVIEYDILVESANENTMVVPYNPTTTTRLEMEDLLLHINSHMDCCRIGFVFSTYRENVSLFVENRPYDDDDNVDWLVALIIKYRIPILDFFGCKTLLYDSWNEYYVKLTEKTGIIIYANTNVTGNSDYGGEWQLSKFYNSNIGNAKSLMRCNHSPVIHRTPSSLLESPELSSNATLTGNYETPIVLMHNIDIKSVYFNSKVHEYKHVLDGLSSTVYIIDTSGYVWSTGNNTSNMLGRGAIGSQFFLGKISSSQAEASFATYNSKIYSVGNGASTGFVSLKDTTNRLYYVGFNGASYAPGFNTAGTKSYYGSCASYNTFVSDTSIVKKIIGPDSIHSYALTASGNLYQTGGSTNFNQAGPSTTITNATLIRKSNTVNISDIQVGLGDPSGNSVLLLLNNGTLYGYGGSVLLGTAGTNGLAAAGKSNPGSTITISGDTSFNQISMSHTHTMVLGKTGKVYCTGYNTKGQFGNNVISGLNTTWYQMTLPRLPSTGAPTISDIVAGNNVSYVIYNDGSLYGCGDNTTNQINSSTTTSYSTLKFIIPPFRKTIKQVTCMLNSTQILTTDNIPYSVGEDSSYGIGIGSSTFATDFTQMSNTADRTVLMTDVSCIGGFSAPITVALKRPIVNLVSPILGGITVVYAAISGVTDTSLNYYYYLDSSTNPVLATSNPFTVSNLSPILHTISLVGRILDSNSNVLWQSSVSLISSGTPYYAESAPQNLILTNSSNTYSLINVQFDTPLTAGNPSRTYYQYAYSTTDTFTFNNITTISTIGNTNSFTISSLTENTTYTIKVRSNNTLVSWTSPEVSGTIKTNSRTQTTINSIEPLLGKLRVNFSNTTTGTEPTTYYYSYSSSGSPRTQITTGSPFDITTSTQQTVYIVADNSGGTTVSQGYTQTPYYAGTIPVVTTITPSSNSLRFDFSGVGGLPSPKYYYSTGSSGTSLLGETTQTTITVSGLTINKPYQYYIVAVGASGATEIWRTTSLITTATKPYITGTSPGVSIVPVDGYENAIKVTYTDSSGGNPAVTKYKYYYTTGGSSTTLTDVSGAINNTFIISGLTKNTYYTVTMQAIGQVSGNDIWTSPNSTSSSVSTNQIGSAPVISANAIDGTTTAINVSITTISNNGSPALTKYQYSTDNGSSFKDLTGISSSYTITTVSSSVVSLVTGTSYQVILRALSGTAWTSPNSTAVSVTTNKVGSAPVITNVSAVNQTTNSLKVLFTNLADGIPITTKYQYYTTPPGVSGVTDVVGLLDGSFIITGLSAGTSYNVTMRSLSTTAWTSAYSSTSTNVSTNTFGSKPSISVASGTGKITVTYSQTTLGTASTSYYYVLNNGSLTSAPASPFDLSGTALTNTSPYSIYVLARNPAGDISSNVATGTVFGSTPTGTATPGPGLNKLTVAFSQSILGTSSTNYYYSYNANPNDPGRTGPVTSTFEISNVSVSTTLYIIASNPAGNLISSGITGTPYYAGQPPTITSVTPSLNSLTFLIGASAGGNPSASIYYYFYLDGSSNPFKTGKYADASSVVVGGLSTGVHTVVIKTKGYLSDASAANTNNAIWTLPDVSGQGTPYILGTTPTITKITPGTNSLLVDGSGSTDGYPSVATYLYSLDGGEYIDANTSTFPITITISNPIVEKVYLVKIKARNAAGDTPASNELGGTPIVELRPQISPSLYWSSQYWAIVSYWRNASYWSKRRR